MAAAFSAAKPVCGEIARPRPVPSRPIGSEPLHHRGQSPAQSCARICAHRRGCPCTGKRLIPFRSTPQRDRAR